MALVAVSTWYSDGDQITNFLTGATKDSGGGALALGPVMYSQAEIDTWATGSEYTVLTGTHIGNAWTPTDYGVSLDSSVEMQEFHEHAIKAFGKAIIWAVTADAGALADVVAYLDGIKDIATIAATNRGQDALEMGWAVCNFVRAAAVVGRANYDDATFDAWLAGIVMDYLDWPTSQNWHATFAAARLMIASYLEDTGLWADAVTYFEGRLAQGVYHSTYDGSTINPLYSSGAYLGDGAGTVLADLFTGTANESATESHWWGAVAHPTYTATDPDDDGAFPDGANAEWRRDLSHEVMSLAPWVYCALTIDRGGGTVSAEARARIRTMTEFTADRVLGWMVAENDSYPTTFEPVDGSPNFVDGAQNYLHGWNAVARWFAGDVPADVTSLLAESDIQSINPGLCHQGLDRFADGSLL